MKLEKRNIFLTNREYLSIFNGIFTNDKKEILIVYNDELKNFYNTETNEKVEIPYTWKLLEIIEKIETCKNLQELENSIPCVCKYSIEILYGDLFLKIVFENVKLKFSFKSEIHSWII